MDKFGRFYTDSKFSELLIDQLSMVSPSHILDLGVGDGSLLSAAMNKWESAFCSAVDIEDKDFKDIPRINFYKKDLLTSESTVTLENFKHKIDIAICNPPYKKIKNSKLYSGLFEEIGFLNCRHLAYVTADLLFLAFNLSILKKEGQLGIILPDTLVTSHDFENFRKDLLKYDVVSIIELPEKIFKKTEAKTYIVVLNNSIKNSNKLVSLLKANKSGEIINKIKVQSCKLIERMDFTHNSIKSILLVEGVTLKEVGAKINRGQFSKKILQKKGMTFFHTSSFNAQKQIFFSNFKEKPVLNFAQKDDILIARVGTRTIGKFCHVKHGNIIISDCILKVTLPKEYVVPFFNALNSSYGASWFKATSHGVCAKLISKRDLLNFRIPL